VSTADRSIRIGTRITHPEEVSIWEADLLQISVYYGRQDNLERLKRCAHACREKEMRYVIHPVMYSIMDRAMFRELKEMAKYSDLALILHDEKTIDWRRLEGDHKKVFRALLSELESISPVSFENATDTADAVWFWNNYANSITLDIGHLELAGINSIEFVKSLDQGIIRRIHYVHMHRNNGWRNGLTDHWYLVPDCREIMALRELLKRTHDIGIFLEINEPEMTGESMKILRALRDEADV
jgi:sugar phosphate isomerase/epimerase